MSTIITNAAPYRTLIEVAKDQPECDLSDDALANIMVATPSQWQSHIPIGIMDRWIAMTEGERAAAFLCCYAAARHSIAKETSS